MKLFRNTVAGLVLGVALTVTYFVGDSMVKNVQFARAQERVDATRAQIANVQDMAAVFKAVGISVEPSVVSIDVKKAPPRGFGRRGGFDPNQGDMLEGTGSGVIVEVDGTTAYVVTNNHVATGALEMTITLSDGRELKGASIVGTDPKTDLAVIKFDAPRLIAAKWGDSSQLQKGDIVMAFGSPMGFVGSMTHGIVSALNRSDVKVIRADYAYENFIQVDAPINPGNSGGPLVNLKGEVVGINTAIASENGGFQGIGLAIPADQARMVYDALRSKGRVVRGYLGVGIEDAIKNDGRAEQLGYTDGGGALINQLMRNTPAYGKLELLDIVTGVNGKPVKNMQEFRNLIAAHGPGSQVNLTVFREKKSQEVEITLGEQPDDSRAVAMTPPVTRPNTAGPLSATKLGLRVESATEALNRENNLDSNLKGAIVTGIAPYSLAMRGRMMEGEMITRVDKTPVSSVEDLNEVLAKKDLSVGVTLYLNGPDTMRTVFIRQP